MFGITTMVFGQRPVPDPDEPIISLTTQTDVHDDENIPTVTLVLEKQDTAVDTRPSAFSTRVSGGRERLVRLGGGTHDWGGCGKRRCLVCLGNHLRGIQHGIKILNYLRMIGGHQWIALHDNLHNGGRGCVDVYHQHTKYHFTGEVQRYDAEVAITVPGWYRAPTVVTWAATTPVYRTYAPTYYYTPAITTYAWGQTW
jgi:hypothetical protein